MRSALYFFLIAGSVFSTSAFAEFVRVKDVAFPAPSLKDVKGGLFTDARGLTLAPTSTVPVEGLFATLGQGFNVFESRILPDAPCIDAVRDDEKFGFESVGQTKKVEYINTVSDMATFESASGSSVGFDLTYKLITVGFETGSHGSNFYNTVDEYGRVYSSIVTKGVSRVGGKFSANAKDARSKGLRKFLDVCGTHYVKSIYWGHQIDETLRFALVNTKYTTADENSFSFGVSKLFGVDYSDTSSETQVKESSSLTLVSDSKGVLGIARPDPNQPGGIKNLVRYARLDFPDAVLKSKPEQSSILYVEVEPYWLLNVDDATKLPRWPDQLKTRIENKLALYEQLLSAMSDAAFALGLGTATLPILYDETPQSAVDKLTAAQKVQEAFRKAVLLCGELAASEDGKDAEAKCVAALDPTLTPKMVLDAKLKRKT